MTMPTYDTIAHSYDELHGEEQERKLRIIHSHIKIGKDARVLDVGCGTGLAATHWEARWTGIDPSEELLKIAATRMNVMKGIAEHLPFNDKSFDAVISLTAIHHCDDPRKAINEMKRVSCGPIAISVLKKAKQYEKITAAIHEL